MQPNKAHDEIVHQTLLTLANIALNIGKKPFHTVENAAMEALRCVQQVCNAQYGAIFLADSRSEFMPALPIDAIPASRLLALSNINPDEARAAFTFGRTVDTEEHIRTWATLRVPENEKNREWYGSLFPWLLLGWKFSEAPTFENACLKMIINPLGATIAAIMSMDYMQKLEIALESKTDAVKDTLLASVSHELRSPLAAIKGYTHTLMRYEKKITAEERKDFLRAISDAGEKLERLVSLLLEYAELESDANNFEKFPLNITQIVDESVQAAEFKTVALANPFIFHFCPPVVYPPPIVVGDSRRMREVFDNIIDNAVKFSPEGGEISIAMKIIVPEKSREDTASSIDNSMVEIIISDKGIGIDTQYLNKIFDRFYRIDNRLIRETSGMGLGLAISKKIVENHNGTIWAESDSVNGSAFHILLPLGANFPDD